MIAAPFQCDVDVIPKGSHYISVSTIKVRLRSFKPSRPSAVKHRPADLVSQPLILQDEFANRIGELFALPMALEPAGALTLASGGGRTRGLDRVGRSTQLVCGDMRHRRGLAGSKGSVPSGSDQLSCRGLGMT